MIFTIAGVTVLSTLAMIVYPVIVGLAGLDAHQTGVFLGGTIHDVAQVVGAGYSISPEVGDYAVLTKLLRVAMLLPVVTAISLAVRHRLQRAEETTAAAIRCCRRSCSPSSRFVIAGSLGLIPKPVGAALNEVARACLVIAIAAVGLKTSPLEMKKVGARAFALLGVEAVFLAGLVLRRRRSSVDACAFAEAGQRMRDRRAVRCTMSRGAVGPKARVGCWTRSGKAESRSER